MSERNPDRWGDEVEISERAYEHMSRCVDALKNIALHAPRGATMETPEGGVMFVTEYARQIVENW